MLAGAGTAAHGLQRAPPAVARRRGCALPPPCVAALAVSDRREQLRGVGCRWGGAPCAVKRVWAYATQHRLKDGRGGIDCDAALFAVFASRRLDFASLSRALTPHLRGAAAEHALQADAGPRVRLSSTLVRFWGQHDPDTLLEAACAADGDGAPASPPRWGFVRR
jgi:hypothetical protein